jgi:hypothetical protein
MWWWSWTAPAARPDEHLGETVRRPIRMALGVARGAGRGEDVVHGAGQPFGQCPHRTARRTPARCFTRTLWRATEDIGPPSKLLLSCRTHYFRTIRHETTHFTGQHRDGPATADYLALLMLPFGEEQLRAYLTANLPGADVDRPLTPRRLPSNWRRSSGPSSPAAPSARSTHWCTGPHERRGLCGWPA